MILHVKLLDEQIDPSHYLYPLTQKYGVKISRSGGSPSVYLFTRSDGFRVRVGHEISPNQVHLKNFAVNVISRNPSYALVEKVIQRYRNRFGGNKGDTENPLVEYPSSYGL